MTLLLACIALSVQPQSIPRAIAFVSENLAKGNGNYYTYLQFEDDQLTIRAGDVLEYRVFIDPSSPIAKGGVDIDFTDGGTPLRDVGVSDQNGLRAHGDGLLQPAEGKWYERRIALDAVKGRTTAKWNLAFEGDLPGKYAQFIDDVVIRHVDGKSTFIYQDQLSGVKNLLQTSGYTQRPSLAAVPTADIKEGANPTVIAHVDAHAARFRALENIRVEINLARQFAEQGGNQHLKQHVDEATNILNRVESNPNSTPEQIQAALHAAKQALSHTHPAMEKYTGHLVGHAHIDLQWLWDWQEGIVATHDTFAQAIKFMDEFPGFTFSQSSSCLYQTIEDHYPELFEKIRQKVKKGQWELVGGRVCEGDTNMISPESHARHFLYGQRYFRERFGRIATVGWEPDTFGHALQMPQILKLGGCNYYYFCRGGKGKPLFWWEGIDGTRILTFDEPASGSWYNGDLSYQQFQEMLNFQGTTGSKDMLWVYGVGNHGGGPTREHIVEALTWMKDPSKPKVRFSTATEFFKKLETYDLKGIPVIAEELNPVFDGCYTSHSEIKRANRDAEAMTTSAEAVAAVASLSGFNYPRAAFRRNWEDITFHHHHDTLPGSGVHSPYEKTKTQLSRVVADGRDIIQRALEHMSLKVTPPKGGISVLVFNPLGWKRSGWVETYLVQSGWYGGERLDPARAVAIGPDGKEHPVVLLDRQSKLARFWAADVPSFGYGVFHLKNGVKPERSLRIDDDKHEIETDRFIVRFDGTLGGISRLYDKRANREVVAHGKALGRVEAHFEKPQSMSAWSIGAIDRVEQLQNNWDISYEKGEGHVFVTLTYYLESHNVPTSKGPSRGSQRFRIEMGADEIPVEVTCDWNAIGTSQQANPMLRVAFDVNLSQPVATYEIPFGVINRPTDGKEYPALKWAELGTAEYGVAILNDSKHGYSANGSTMWLSLIRSSFDPDPVPNPGRHVWNYSIYPHSGEWRLGSVTQRAAEMNQPLVSATVPFDARGAAPLSWSPVSVTDSSVVATGLKVSEDDKDRVLRVYQNSATPSTGSVQFGLPVASVNWVNFLEDRLGVGALQGSRLPLSLRGFEIRTMKIKRKL